jgi:hypothetical protein
MEPGLFYGTWLVAAKEQATSLVSIDLQNRIYFGARALSTAATLGATGFALFIWRRRWLPLFRLRGAP